MAAQPLGSRWMRAVNTARSVLSMRGRGLVRRSTATSCRSTRSSTSLADARNASRTSPSTFRKIRYSSRSDTAAIMPNPWATPIIRPIADARRARRRRRPDRAAVHLHHRPHHAGAGEGSPATRPDRWPSSPDRSPQQPGSWRHAHRTRWKRIGRICCRTTRCAAAAHRQEQPPTAFA